MKRIGRRLIFAFTPKTNIIITKLAVNLYGLDKEGLIQDVLDYNGELIYKTAGNTIQQAYGQDVNTLLSESKFWFTEEEYKQMNTK